MTPISMLQTLSLMKAVGLAVDEVERIAKETCTALDAHQNTLTGEAQEAWHAVRADKLSGALEMHAEGMRRTLVSVNKALQEQADKIRGRSICRCMSNEAADGMGTSAP